MKPVGREMTEKGKELAPLRERAYRELDQNPELTAEQLSEMLGVNKSTIYGWKKRWKRKKPLGNEAQPPKEEAPQEEITPESVADALLKRVVDALTEHERLLAEINECKNLTREMGKALETERQEKDRILKIHNDQVKTRRVTDSETIRRLAKL